VAKKQHRVKRWLEDNSVVTILAVCLVLVLAWIVTAIETHPGEQSSNESIGHAKRHAIPKVLLHPLL
jgi:hypothetical protein